MGKKQKEVIEMENNIETQGENKKLSLNEMKEFIEKQVKGSKIFNLKDTKAVNIQGISSGSMCLNMKLSGNPFVGFEFGRIVELYGPEASSKSTLAATIITEGQKLNAPCGYIDAEYAIDENYFEQIGIQIDKLVVNQPDYGEQALEVLEAMLDAGIKIIVFDSVAALVPLAEIQGTAGDSHMGLQARLMSQALRRLTSKIAKKKALVIFINQLRSKVGIIFGSPEVTTCGNALKFYSSYRLDMRSPRGGAIETKDMNAVSNEIGSKVNVTIVKNKVFPPHKKASFDVLYGKGIDKNADMIDFVNTYMNDLFIQSKDEKKKTLVWILNEKEYTAKQLEKIIVDDKELFDLVLQKINERYNKK